MILYINTSQKEKFTLGLYENKLILKTIQSPIGTMSEKFLLELDKFLKSNKTSLKNISAVIVFQGPGSYTSLRIGISIANALAWSLDISIIGMLAKNLKLKAKSISLKLKGKIGFNKPVIPFYQQEIQ